MDRIKSAVHTPWAEVAVWWCFKTPHNFFFTKQFSLLLSFIHHFFLLKGVISTIGIFVGCMKYVACCVVVSLAHPKLLALGNGDFSFYAACLLTPKYILLLRTKRQGYKSQAMHHFFLLLWDALHFFGSSALSLSKPCLPASVWQGPFSHLWMCALCSASALFCC